MEQQTLWLLQRIFNSDTNPIVIKEGLYKIGRSPESNIFCKSEWVSRFHCDVTVRGGNVYIKDLGSLNGTYIEQTEILKERDLQLKDGDIISLGKPFLGDMPENSHYVYRLVACNAPQEPKKRKRVASLSPPTENLKEICSPKRIRESIEKQKKDSLTKQQSLTPKPEVSLENGAECDQNRNAVPSHTSVSINQVSSSDKEMDCIECIDLTDDGSENALVNKSSSSGSAANEGSTSPDSSGFKIPIPPTLNASSLDKNVEILRAVMTLLQNNESDKVLKHIENLSGVVEKPDVFQKIPAHNQSIAGRSLLSSNYEKIISSNVPITIPDELSSSQPVELDSKLNSMKMEVDVEVNSMKTIEKNKENVSDLETKEILNENLWKEENKKELRLYEPDPIQPPSDPVHSSHIISSSIGSACTSVLSDLKKVGNGNEHNYKPQLKKTRSDSFTSEMDKLDNLLKGLNGNKEANGSLDHNEKLSADPINIKNEMKLTEANDEIHKEIFNCKKDNVGKTDNIKTFHKSIVTTCRDNELLRKNYADASPIELKSNTVINLKQLTFSEEDKVEVILCSPPRSDSEREKSEVDSISPSGSKPDVEESEVYVSPSRRKSESEKLEVGEIVSPKRIMVERELDELDIPSKRKSGTEKLEVAVVSPSGSKSEKGKLEVAMVSPSESKSEKGKLEVAMVSPSESKSEKGKLEVAMVSPSESKSEKGKLEVAMVSPSGSKHEKDKLEVAMVSPSESKPEKGSSEVAMVSPSGSKSEKGKLEVAMISPSGSKPETEKLDEVDMASPSTSKPSTPSPSGPEENAFVGIKQELSFEPNDIEEPMVFSQDMDAVVVLDESEDELEYSQLFMELDEVNKEVVNEKADVCIKEEFLYEDNEEMDFFQSHFSQCSQDLEMELAESPKKKKVKSESPQKKKVKSESPKKKKVKSDLPSSSSKKKETKVKSPRSTGKDKNVRDVRVKLKRLDMDILSKTKGTTEENISESGSKNVKTDCSKKDNKIIDLDKLEIIKCNEKNNVDVESFELLKKSKSDETDTSSIQTDEKSETSLKKNESHTKSKTNKISLRKASSESNLINRSRTEKNMVGENKKLDVDKSVSKLESMVNEPNENCPPSNEIKKNSNKPEINKHLNEIVSLPPPESISGAKLVKSTLLSKPPTPIRKKPGRPRKSEPSVTRDSLNKRKQKQLVEDRKAKLKSLALEASSKMVEGKERDHVHKEQVTPKSDTSPSDKSVTRSDSKEKKNGAQNKAIGVAKITERNRGSILLEGFLEDPCRKSRTRKKIETANNALKNPEPIVRRTASCDKLKEPSSASKVGPVVPSLPKVNASGLRSCLKSPGRSSSIKKVQFNLKMEVKIFECEGTMKSVNAMGLKDKAPSTPIPMPLVAPVVPVITTLEETYYDIVHWNASWISEIKVIPGEPPVHAERYNAKDSYVSYKDYKRWLYPLMMYELWANMCKTMDDEDANKTGRAFDGIVLESMQYGIHSANGKNLSLLKCFFPLYGKQAQSMVEAMDILLIKALSAVEGKRIFFVMFGLVYSAIKINSYRDTIDPVARHYLTTLNRKPDLCAYFDIIIYKSQKKQLSTGFQLRIRPTYNMMTELREFESLIKLASSPLSDIIIDPVTNNSIYLQKDMNDKIVTQYPLNDDQRKAILCTTQSVFANKPSISLIHGPPGTGKTQVIVSIVEQLLYRFKLKTNYQRKKILICSHSNTAIDEICLRLLDIHQQLPREKRFKLTRFGRKERMHPRVAEIKTATLARKEVEKRNLNEDFNLELSLNKATERMVATALENPASPKIESYKRRYEQVQKRIACLEALMNNKDSNNETRLKEIERMVFDEEMKVIYHSDIIATTLGSCAQRRITKAFSDMSRSGEERREVGVCIIDEATQATEADSLLPLVYDVKNFILVGDPQQLPPFVASQTAKKFGLCQSLFARLYKVWHGLPSAPVYMLTAQHRMHPEIAKFPSKAFYDNKLTTPSFLAIKRPFKPYAVITHTLLQDTSETNLSEAKLMVEMAEKLLLEPAMKGLSIGLIVPYQRQRTIIQDLFLDKKLAKQLSVNTIDSYQGQERDVILLSIVRTSGVGFLIDHQRLNVALTRARKAMYIVGNFTSLQSADIWKELLRDAKERNLQYEAGRAEKVEDIFGFLFERNCKKSRTSNS